MAMRLVAHYFVLEGQKTSPAVDEIETAPKKIRASILSDIELVAEHGLRAPVSIKSITGHTPLRELRNGAFRTFFVVDRGELWVLHCCHKDDQQHGIGLADERMRLVQER